MEAATSGAEPKSPEPLINASAAMKPCLWTRCKYSMGGDGILRFGGALTSRSFAKLLNAAAPTLARNIEKLRSRSPISVQDLGKSSHSIMLVRGCPFTSVRNVKDDIVLIDFAWIKILQKYLNDRRFVGVVKWLVSERLIHEIFHADTETNQTIRDIYYQCLITPELAKGINAFFNLPDVKESGIARKTKARFKFLEEQAYYLKKGRSIDMPGIINFVGKYDVPIELENSSYQPMVGSQEPRTPVTVSPGAMAWTFFNKVWKNRVIIAKALVFMSSLSILLYCLLSFTLPDNEKLDFIEECVERCSLDAVQIHGDEDVNYCLKFKDLKLQGVKLIKGLRARDRESLSVIEDCPADAILLDAYKKDEYGGTGQGFDRTLAIIAKEYGKNLIISGGLNSDNVYDIIKEVKPYGVDVSSGIESSPGKKNMELMEEFIEEVRRAEQPRL